MNIEHQYLSALQMVGANGVYREGRNGGTYSMFGHQMRHDMRLGFPLLTTKKVHFKSIAVELLWFLRGGTNVDFLHQHGVSIWDEWADDKGELGPVYGKQWRSWPGKPELGGINDTYWIDDTPIDQITQLIANLKADPFSRRHIVSAWNPAEIGDMALPPCHTMFQFYASPGIDASGNHVLWLDLQLYQRSGDMFLGVPFNIASYALLLQLIGREVTMIPRYFIHTLGDYHLYGNHVEQAETQLLRQPKALPMVGIEQNNLKSIFEIEWEDLFLFDYDPHPSIKAEVSK